MDVDAEGRIVVATGAAPQGQGHATTLAAIVAGELGAPDGTGASVLKHLLAGRASVPPNMVVFLDRTGPR